MAIYWSFMMCHKCDKCCYMHKFLIYIYVKVYDYHLHLISEKTEDQRGTGVYSRSPSQCNSELGPRCVSRILDLNRSPILLQYKNLQVWSKFILNSVSNEHRKPLKQRHQMASLWICKDVRFLKYRRRNCIIIRCSRKDYIVWSLGLKKNCSYLLSSFVCHYEDCDK